MDLKYGHEGICALISFYISGFEELEKKVPSPAAIGSEKESVFCTSAAINQPVLQRSFSQSTFLLQRCCSLLTCSLSSSIQERLLLDYISVNGNWLFTLEIELIAIFLHPVIGCESSQKTQ